jgi:hypothetical protein
VLGAVRAPPQVYLMYDSIRFLNLPHSFRRGLPCRLHYIYAQVEEFTCSLSHPLESLVRYPILGSVRYCSSRMSDRLPTCGRKNIEIVTRKAACRLHRMSSKNRFQGESKTRLLKSRMSYFYYAFSEQDMFLSFKVLE